MRLLLVLVCLYIPIASATGDKVYIYLRRDPSENTPLIRPHMSNGTCLIDAKALFVVAPAEGKTIDDYKFYLEICEEAPAADQPENQPKDQQVQCQKVSKIYPDCSDDCTEYNEFDSNIRFSFNDSYTPKRLFLWVRVADSRHFPAKDYPAGRSFLFRMVMNDSDGTPIKHPESEILQFSSKKCEDAEPEIQPTEMNPTKNPTGAPSKASTDSPTSTGISTDDSTSKHEKEAQKEKSTDASVTSKHEKKEQKEVPTVLPTKTVAEPTTGAGSNIRSSDDEIDAEKNGISRLTNFSGLIYILALPLADYLAL